MPRKSGGCAELTVIHGRGVKIPIDIGSYLLYIGAQE
jgi:hypothetical protein